jgi:tetratricopeptide (TPR) repeat protein
LAAVLNLRIETLEQSRDTSQEEELVQTRHLRKCLRSSATVVSTASTIRGERQEDVRSLNAGSDFDDCLPESPIDRMNDWFAASRIQEERQGGAQLFDSRSTAPLAGVASESDSDGDLEADMTRALFKAGTEKLAAADYQHAERLLRNCNSRLSSTSSPAKPIRTSKQVELKLEVLDGLGKVYIKQQNWEQAQIVVTEKLSLSRSHSKGDESVTETLMDVLSLANVLVERKSYPEASLQARRALRGYKKLGRGGEHGTEQALKMLTRICTAEGNTDELEAYALLLAEVQSAQLLGASQHDIQRKVEPSSKPSSSSSRAVGSTENSEPKVGAQENIPPPPGPSAPRVGSVSSDSGSSLNTNEDSSTFSHE